MQWFIKNLLLEFVRSIISFFLAKGRGCITWRGFVNFTKFGRNYLSRIICFYKWKRNIQFNIGRGSSNSISRRGFFNSSICSRFSDNEKQGTLQSCTKSLKPSCYSEFFVDSDASNMDSSDCCWIDSSDNCSDNAGMKDHSHFGKD